VRSLVVAGREASARAARRGALVGLAGLLAFFVLHALIVTPIWTRLDAWARGLVLAPAAGALLGVALVRLRPREPRFAQPLGGMLLGALAGLALAPFAIAGWMRSRGAPDPFWLLILGLLVASLYHVTQAAQQGAGRARRQELFGTMLLANAYPAYFLTFIGDFHDEAPNPFPFTLAVASIYIAAGALLGKIAK